MISANAATVARDVGRILRVVALMTVVSSLVAIFHREFYAIPGFLFTGALMGGAGTVLVRACSDAPDPEKLHGMLIAASGWMIVSIFGALPFFLISWTLQIGVPEWLNPIGMNSTLVVFLNPLNGIFESLSGFTSTGLTMAVTEEELPASIQWWRSFTEWVGGVGVIVLTVAILARPGSGSLTLYESEARSQKIHPSIVSTVHSIWWIYLGLTCGGILLFLLAGMPLWGAINHAMTGIATGGFSIHSDSIGYYNSPLIEYAVVPVMIAGSIAFPVHYLILKGELKNFYTDIQTRWVFIWFTIGSILLISVLYISNIYPTFEEAFRIGLFQFVSATSNTGFGTASVGGVWGAGPILIMCAGMFTGAAAGSTVGGIKLIRAITLSKGILWRVSNVFYPSSAVRQFKLGERRLTDDELSREFEEAAIVAILWVIFLAIGIAVLIIALPSDTPLEYLIFEVISAQSTVGLSAGITDPSMPTSTKIMFLLNMWVGRLEIIPVVVLLRGIFKGLDYYE